jgi:transposase
MAHCNSSIHERVIALAEEGGLSASTAGELCGVPKSTARAWLQKYQRDGQVGRRRVTGIWRVSSRAQDATLVIEAQKNPCVSARDLKAATGFLGQRKHSYFETKWSGPQGTAHCGEGVSRWRVQTIPFSICWEPFRSQVGQNHIR